MSQQYICTMCGNVGKPKSKTKGSFAIELIFWCLFIIPGLFYSHWRSKTKTFVCPKCKNPNMIPLDTPMGQKLMSQLHGEQK